MSARRKIFLLLAILWMTMIFAVSSRTGTLSTEDSHGVGRIVGRLVYEDFDSWPLSEQYAFEDKVDYPVRKGAHATEYACLAILAFQVLGAGACLRRAAWGGWLWATAYAATDEFHQLFVEGRSGEAKDVCIDSCGALAGILLSVLICVLICRRERRKQAALPADSGK